MEKVTKEFKKKPEPERHDWLTGLIVLAFCATFVYKNYIDEQAKQFE